MCGIFGMFLRRPLGPRDIALGRSGTLKLRHRGPDAGGEYLDADSGVFVGHRRLKIIDLSEASAQPMQCGPIILSYNGEAYNFEDLRTVLEGKGVTFRSTGDAEVVGQSWREWGEGSLEKLDAMFAMAIWDGHRGWLAVDRFGEKPLYYAEVEDGLYYSSELEPLLVILGDAVEPKSDWVSEFISLGCIDAPSTAYKNIRCVPPSTCLRIEAGRVVGTRRYWEYPLGEPARSKAQPLSEKGIDRIRDALLSSIERRLKADVGAALFLSTGVDSLLIASLMAKDLGRTLPCITVGFADDEAHDESQLSAAAARALNLEHRVLPTPGEASPIGAGEVLDLFGEPNDNLTVASMYRLSQAAAGDGFAVALSGTGGDEVCFGYRKNVLAERLDALYRVPAWLRRSVSAFPGPKQLTPAKLNIFRALFGVPDNQLYLALKNQPTVAALNLVPGFREWAADKYERTNLRFSSEVGMREATAMLPSSHLRAADRGSMRASVEMRAPFLSAELVETIATFDPRSFTRFGQKEPTRRLLSRYLPQYAQRKKKGFRYPLRRFLSAYPEVPHEMESLLSREFCDFVWARRERPGFERLALRIAIGSEFFNRIDASAVARSSKSIV